MEVIVVVGLIMLLLVFIVRNAQKNRAEARDNVRISDIQIMRLAIEEYKLSCGEYPSKISLTTNNSCYNGQTLSDFLPRIPVNPIYPDGSLIVAAGLDSNSEIVGSNGYLYAGKSTTTNGPCYDYHIGVELEISPDNGETNSYLDKDHDALKSSGTYKNNCSGAASDFGSTDTSSDDNMGLYDLRSKSIY